VVDDSRDAAEMVAEFLRTAGHEAPVAYDAPKALALIDRFRSAVMVLDIGLPHDRKRSRALTLDDHMTPRADAPDGVHTTFNAAPSMIR
jgi:DNA-binding response OmpR family regulator